MNDTINNALNETLSRTIITSLTTLVVIMSLYLYGGAIIKLFSLTLIIGIMVGTYSSLFIATPVMRLMYGKFNQYNEELGD